MWMQFGELTLRQSFVFVFASKEGCSKDLLPPIVCMLQCGQELLRLVSFFCKYWRTGAQTILVPF